VGLESQGFRVNGNIIGIDHGQSVATAYLHLSRIDVKVGQMVEAGQVIGAVGSSGAVTGAHLHWGLYVKGESVDPAPWIRSGFE
jgi:lysostaphin